MSLIEEALRRQQEESGDSPDASKQTIGLRKTGAQAASPATAQPASAETAAPALDSRSPVRPQPEGGGRRGLPAILGVLLLVLILGGGGAWMLVYALKHWKSQPQESGGAPPAPAAEAPPPVVPTPAPAAPDDSASVRPEPTNAASAAAAASAPEPIAPPTPTQAPAVTAPPPAPEPPPAVAEPPQPKPALRWPAFSLDGVVGKGQHGAARLDGQIVAVGESVNGIKVVAIGSQGATLEHKGEQRFVKVGQSAE
jgi:hypothetical protein